MKFDKIEKIGAAILCVYIVGLIVIMCMSSGKVSSPRKVVMPYYDTGKCGCI